jgi:hypothetical protein
MKAPFESSSGCGNFGFGILDFGLGTKPTLFWRSFQCFAVKGAKVALAHGFACNPKSQI